MVDVDGVLRRGRAAADALYTDACVVERRTGRVLDDDTLEYVDKWDPLYGGRCRVQIRAIQPAQEATAGRTWVVTDGVVQLPVTDVAYADDDRVRITKCVHDPELVGVVLSVTSREAKSHATMRRLHVSEVSS